MVCLGVRHLKPTRRVRVVFLCRRDCNAWLHSFKHNKVQATWRPGGIKETVLQDLCLPSSLLFSLLPTLYQSSNDVLHRLPSPAIGYCPFQPMYKNSLDGINPGVDAGLPAPALTSSSQSTPLPPGTVLMIDSFVQRLHLTTDQKKDLGALYKVSFIDLYTLTRTHSFPSIQLCIKASLSHADAVVRVFTLACQYGSERRIIEATRSAPPQMASGGPTLENLLKELTLRLEDSWVVTGEQRVRVL